MRRRCWISVLVIDRLLQAPLALAEKFAPRAAFLDGSSAQSRSEDATLRPP